MEEDKDYGVCPNCGGYNFQETIEGTQNWNSKTGEITNVNAERNESTGMFCSDCGENIDADEELPTRAEWEKLK